MQEGDICISDPSALIPSESESSNRQLKYKIRIYNNAQEQEFSSDSDGVANHLPARVPPPNYEDKY